MTSTSSQHNWSSEFEIDPSVVFLNHAAFGPVTNRGRRAIDSYFARWGQFAAGPDVDQESYALLSQAREGFASMIGGDSKRVAFVSNASVGLNTALWGLDLQRGERLLVPEVEFPAIVYVAQHIARKRDLQLDVLECPDGYFTPGALEDALQTKTAALVFSWVQYFNGYRYDLKAITDICHRYGCFVLADATQGIGAVPINVRDSGTDALACGAQKWLFGQPGSGFMYLAPEPIRRVQPLYAGWLGVDWSYRFNDLRRWDRPPYEDGRQWEVGTYPYCALRFAQAGLEMLLECGIDEIWRRIQALHQRLQSGLDGTQYTAKTFVETHASGIVTIHGPRVDELQKTLTARRIYTSLREGSVRVSPHFYNTADDIDRLITAIHEFDCS